MGWIKLVDRRSSVNSELYRTVLMSLGRTATFSCPFADRLYGTHLYLINPLAPELFFFLISAHPVYKMWIIQEPKKLSLWNKLHFEEKKTESIEHV